MSIKLTKRVASALMKRGKTAVKLNPAFLEDARKALTREDVREMIKKGSIYAVKPKHNLSLYGGILNKKREQGRKRGRGKRRGTAKARSGVEYKKEIRAQRRVLAALKTEKTIDNQLFKKLYALVKGGTFSNKVTLLNRVRSEGVTLDDERFEKLRHL